MKLDYKLIANWIIALFVLYSLSMFLLEKRMNRAQQKYETECIVIDKYTAGSRTNRVEIQYNRKLYEIDSDKLYYNTQKGDKIKLLYFSPLDMFMIPNEKNYFELFWISLLIGCILKALIYFKE